MRSCLWLCLPLLVLFAACDLRADDVSDQAAILKKKEYGDFWDRLDAFRKLGTIANLKAAEAVGEYLDDEEAPIREAAVQSLARMDKDDAVVQYLATKLLNHPKPMVRAHAAWALGMIKGAAAIKALEATLAKGAETPEVRCVAARSLGLIGEKASAEALKAQVAGTGPPAIRAECLFAMAELGAGDLATVLAAIKDSHPEVRAAAIAAGAKIDGKGAAEAVKGALGDADAKVRTAVGDALEPCLGEAALEPATKLLSDKEWPVRVAAIGALVEVWTKDAVEALINRMPDEKGRLRFDLSHGLTEMTGKDIGYDPLAWKGWWESNKATFELPKKPKKRGARQVKDAPGGTGASFFNIPIISDRIAFVIDFSGSMKTEEKRTPDGKSVAGGADDILKIDIAITELERCLGKLDPKVRFNVFLMCYAHNPVVLERTGFSKNLVTATPANLKNAAKFVDDAKKAVMAVKRGRGDMWDQLLNAFQDEDVDTVIILSDGKPSYGKYVDNDNFHYFLGRENRYRKIMLHTVLTGTKGIDAKFMEQLAGDTGGMFTKK